MNTTNAAPATRTTWLVIVVAMIGSIGMYLGLAYFLQEQRAAAPPAGETLAAVRTAMYALAGVALLGAVAWLTVRARGTGEGISTATGAPTLPPPARFQTDSIIALALAEAVAIFGLVFFFLGAPLTEFVRFAAASAAVMLLFILPKGLAYWSAWERQQGMSEREADGLR